MFFFDILQIPSGCVQICNGCMNTRFEFIVPLRLNCPNASPDILSSVVLVCGVSTGLPHTHISSDMKATHCSVL